MRGSGVRVALPALGVLTLVGVVAVAATGTTPSGSGKTRTLGDVLLDTAFSLFLLALVPAVALLVYGLMQRKGIAEEMASRQFKRMRFASYVYLVLLLFGLAAYFRMRGQNWSFLGGGNPNEVPPLGAPPPGIEASDDVRVYEPEFAWLPVLVLLALLAAGLAAWQLAIRREKASHANETVAEDLADAIDDSLEDLLAESDPRRAVIAAYARLERVLAAYGLPRHPSETQEEYLARILGDLDVDTASVRRLTDLFTRAKFSQHDVDAQMKEEAVATLAEVRDELRAAEERRVEALRQPLLAERV